MPGSALNILHRFNPGSLTTCTNLYAYFKDEETEIMKLNNLPKIT